MTTYSQHIMNWPLNTLQTGH